MPSGEKIRDALKPYRKIRKYEYPGLEVDDVGFDEITRICRSSRAISEGWSFVVPDDFNRGWLVRSGELQGTFPKRLNHYYYKYARHNGKSPTNLPNDIVTEIGNVAQQHAGASLTYYYDITDRIDWCSGDFGDSGSCYWDEHQGAKDMLKEHDSLAIRFFHTKSGGGWGRAWIVFPTMHDIVLKGGGHPTFPRNICLVYNSYPTHHSLCRVARVLSMILGLSYRGPVDFYNNGTDGGELYINGGRCYLIGDDASISDIEGVELHWDEISGYHCDSCGNQMGEDDRMLSPNGDSLCESCFDEQCFTCFGCAETYYRDPELVISGRHYYCHDCAESNGIYECTKCGEWGKDYQIESDDRYCQGCFDKLFFRCQVCDGVFERTTIRIRETVCEDCAKEEEEEPA